MCQCFHCCSSRNEQRDEKWFCSDSLALCVWQTFVLGKFARQMVVITVVISKPSCVSSSGLRLLEYFGDSSGRLDASFRGRAHFACVLQMILDSFHSPHESVRTTHGRRRLFLALCSMWQQVFGAAYAVAFSNEIGGACRCVLGVQTACGSSLRLLEHFGDFPGHIFCSLGSCAQVAPRHGVRRAYLPTMEVSLLSVGLSMSPQRESSCRPYSCALSRT